MQGIAELEKKYLEVHAERTALLLEGLSKNDQKLSKLLEEEQNLSTRVSCSSGGLVQQGQLARAMAALKTFTIDYRIVASTSGQVRRG